MTFDELESMLKSIEREFVRQQQDIEVLIGALKPFAYKWQNSQCDPYDWEDNYRAHNVLVDILGEERYLEENTDAQ